MSGYNIVFLTFYFYHWLCYCIIPSDCSWRPTSKASLSLEELLERQARYWNIISFSLGLKLMSVVLPCRCCNVAVEWHFHTAKFCAQSLNLYPGILKYFTVPYKNISILIKLQFRPNIRNILFLFQSKYFKWTKYFLTASASLEEMISCRARTDRACSITNTHWERSGGTFWNIFRVLQCYLFSYYSIVIFEEWWESEKRG